MEPRTFRYKDGQIYETDQETLDLMKKLHELETDPKWVKVQQAIRAWEPQANEEALSDIVFETGRENGRIHEPARELIHTIDIDGARFAASTETMESIDEALQAGKIDPEDGLNPYEIEDRQGRFDLTIDHAIRRGDLVYLEPAPSELFAIDGDHETPMERRAREREEYDERRQDEVQIEDIRSGDMAATPEGVRLALGMEPDEAVRRGLMTEIVIDGACAYEANPEAVRAALGPIATDLAVTDVMVNEGPEISL